jgi:hypothetical protein
METRIPLNTKFSVELTRLQQVKSVIPIGSWWEFEQWRNGKLINQWGQKNVNTNEGINHMLNVVFVGATHITTWYIGLFENNYTPFVTDTYASPGFTECAAYAEGLRQTFIGATSTGKVMTNTANKAVFTINASKTLYGAFLCGGGTAPTTIGNTAGGGTLFASSLFLSSLSVVSTDSIRILCGITLADV